MSAGPCVWASALALSQSFEIRVPSLQPWCHDPASVPLSVKQAVKETEMSAAAFGAVSLFTNVIQLLLPKHSYCMGPSKLQRSPAWLHEKHSLASRPLPGRSACPSLPSSPQSQEEGQERGTQPLTNLKPLRASSPPLSEEWSGCWWS